jgi:hypothetical protein
MAKGASIKPTTKIGMNTTAATRGIFELISDFTTLP